METITLSSEQKTLFTIMENTKKHLFITGRAGTGKSFLLRYFRENTNKRIVVVAPTGIAALNVSGKTIHSLFGLDQNVHVYGELEENEKVCTLLKRVDAIVIDEVSMVRADLLDAINERLQEAMESDEAFGGKQIIMFGDVYQLPPVVDKGLSEYFEHVHKGYFFFNALAWKHVGFKIYELSQVFRQKDPAFRDILNAVRNGTITDSQIELLNTCYGKKVPKEGTVTLASTNALVTRINQNKLDRLTDEMFTYRAIITGKMQRATFPTEEVLQLKKHAQIVMLKNDLKGRWVNGTVGMIEKLSKEKIEVKIDGTVYTIEKETWEETEYTYDQETQKIESRVISSFTQFPVRLAWSLTIHKSQGQTYDSVEVDLTIATFLAGQLYVALSRATSLEGLYLKKPVKRAHIIVDSKVAEFMLRCEVIEIEAIEAESTPPDDTSTHEDDSKTRVDGQETPIEEETTQPYTEPDARPLLLLSQHIEKLKPDTQEENISQEDNGTSEEYQNSSECSPDKQETAIADDTAQLYLDVRASSLVSVDDSQEVPASEVDVQDKAVETTSVKERGHRKAIAQNDKKVTLPITQDPSLNEGLREFTEVLQSMGDSAREIVEYEGLKLSMSDVMLAALMAYGPFTDYFKTTEHYAAYLDRKERTTSKREKARRASK